MGTYRDEANRLTPFSHPEPEAEVRAPRWLRGLAQAVMAGAFVAALAVIFLVVYALAEMVL